MKRILRIPKPLRRQVADDVEAEIRFHLETRTEELVARGLSPEEAQARAEREFGDADAAGRELREQATRTERRHRRLELLDQLGQDVRYGWRTLRRSPGFAIVTVLTLALAIGANTAIFSVVNAVLFRPLPFPAPDRLVAVWESHPNASLRNSVSSGGYLAYRDDNRTFEAIGAHSWHDQAALAADGPPVELYAVRMSPEAFQALDAPALVGRTFLPEEGEAGSERAVVLSHRLWQSRFGGDREVIGRTLTLSDLDHTVVGVMGPGFAYPKADVEVWISLRFSEADREQQRAHQWLVIGRLAPGVTVERANADLDAIAARLEREYPQFKTDWTTNVQPYRADLTGDVRPLMLVLLGVVGLVLLIACANIANLLLARLMARTREIAVRGALGAGRSRLLRQFLTESLMIAGLGGTLGLLIAAGTLDLFVAFAPEDIPLLEGTRIDTAVFGFAVAATVLATMLFGLLPSLRSTRLELNDALAAGSGRSAGGRRHTRLRSAILVTQVALSAMLLIGAGLLIRSMVGLQRVDYGYDPEGLLAVTLLPPQTRYPTAEEQAGLFDPLLERVRGMPGVQTVAGTSEPPVTGFQMTFSFAIQSRPRVGPSETGTAYDLRVVTEEFYETMGIPLRRGRLPDARDHADAPGVVAITQALADREWPGDDPLGERISFQGREGPWLEIVGVVGDVRQRATERAPEPAVYMPWKQKQWNWISFMTLVVRAEGDPTRLVRPIEQAVWALDDKLPIRRAALVTDFYAESRARKRFATALLGAFAGLALLLGGIGLYGVLSYQVVQRRKEIGIRIALGAERRSVAASVVGQGVRLALAGIALGVLGAFGLTRLLRSLLYGVEAIDPLTFAVIPLVLLGVAALAAYLPARRASRVDPAGVLRGV